MNSPRSNSIPFDDAIDTAAAEWLCEREEGFMAGRAAAFAAWCAADPRHQAAVTRTELALGLLDEMPVVRAPLQARIAEHSRAAGRTMVRPDFRVPAWAGGLAAVLLLSFGAWWLSTGTEDEAQHFATASARQQQVALSDGSVVNLNVSTDVSIRLLANERRVTLATGEAHFAVAHDAARPFIVSAGGVAVRAVGTAFNVRVGERGVEILVTEGRVEITNEATVSKPEARPSVSRPTLVAGERATISRDASTAPAKVERVTDAVLQDAIRWHSRLMTFSNLPLREAVMLFNRRNEIQLVLLDEKLGSERIGGTFAASEVEAFVRLLEKDGDIVAERRGPGEILLRRAL